MKKVLSIVAALSMFATMATSFVTVSAATITPTVDVKATAMTNDEFYAIAEMDIPEGYAMYNLTVDLSDIGELKYYKDGLKYSGRLLDVGQITVEDLGTYADADFTMVLSNCFEQTATEGFDGANFTAAYASGAVNACYPYTATTVTAVDDMYSILVGAKTTESFTLDYTVSGCISTWTKAVAPTSEDLMENFTVTGTVTFGETAQEEKTVWTSEDNEKIPAGKKIVAHSENVTGVTADTRVTVTVDGDSKTFGNNIGTYFASKGIDLDGFADFNIRFAVLVNEAVESISFVVE